MAAARRKHFLCWGLAALLVLVFSALRINWHLMHFSIDLRSREPMKSAGRIAGKTNDPPLYQSSSQQQQQSQPYPFHPVVSDGQQQQLTLYSARFNEKAKTVTLVGYYRRSLRVSQLRCRLELDTGEVRAAASVSQHPINEGHSRPFDGIQFVCGLPPYVRRVVGVRFSADCGGRSGSARLAVASPPPPPPDATVGACIAALRHRPDEESEASMALRLVEFVETNRRLGVGHFYFYNWSLPASISRILRHYESRRLATVLQFGLGNLRPQLDIHYFGQMVVTNDCLALAKTRHRWVAFVDIDEFLVPIGASSLQQLAQRHVSKGFCAIAFRHAVFPSWQRASTLSTAEAPASIRNCSLATLTHRLHDRNVMAFGVRSKLLVQASDIDEMGIHFAWRTRGGCKTRVLHPSSEGLLHHYRRWGQLAGLVHSDWLRPFRRESALAIAHTLAELRRRHSLGLC